jgi:L-lactate dehydrogenase complex protein LldG
VLRAAGEEEARAELSRALAEANARRLCWWRGDALVDALDPAGLGERVQPADADAGITGADAAVAATGTLVLTYGEGRDRATGLLPDLHVAVLRTSSIVETLADAMARVYTAGTRRPAAVTLVTGASATSDIERIRVTGVHGPRRVIALVVGEG